MSGVHNWLRRRIPWRYWIGLLVIWTALLLTPADWYGKTGSAKVGVLSIGKLLHIGTYFLLSASAGWLRPAFSIRLAVVPLLILHGGLTEWLQTFVRGREGCWRDIGIDTAGVLAGFLLTWWFWPPSVAPVSTKRSTSPL